MRLPAELWAPRLIHHSRTQVLAAFAAGRGLPGAVRDAVDQGKERQQGSPAVLWHARVRALVASVGGRQTRRSVQVAHQVRCGHLQHLPASRAPPPSEFSHVMLSGGCVVAGTTRGWALAPQQRAASTSPTLHGITAPSRGRRQTMTTASRWPSPRLRCVAGIPGLLDSTPRV